MHKTKLPKLEGGDKMLSACELQRSKPKTANALVKSPPDQCQERLTLLYLSISKKESLPMLRT